MNYVTVQWKLLTLFHCDHMEELLLRKHWNLPVWKHWILNVQSFTPRFKPVYVPSGPAPEPVWVVSGCGEGSVIRRVGRIVPAALQGHRLVDVCTCVRPFCSCATSVCCTKRPHFPPDGPFAKSQTHYVFDLDLHCCCSFKRHTVAGSFCFRCFRAGRGLALEDVH